MKFISLISKTGVVLLFISLFATVGCTRLVMRVMGMKYPKAETEATMIAWLEKHNISLEDCFMIDSLRPDVSSEIMLFGKNGYRIRQPDVCYPDVRSAIYSVPGYQVHDFDSTMTLNPYAERLVKFDGKGISSLDAGQDLTLVVPWAIFLHKKNTLAEYESLPRDTLGIKLRIVKVNIDFQKSWGIKKPQVSGIKMSNKK
jgi:hypothetical protein